MTEQITSLGLTTMNYCSLKGLISLASPDQGGILWGKSSALALLLLLALAPLLAQALSFPAIGAAGSGHSHPHPSKKKQNTAEWVTDYCRQSGNCVWCWEEMKSVNVFPSWVKWNTDEKDTRCGSLTVMSVRSQLELQAWYPMILKVL